MIVTNINITNFNGNISGSIVIHESGDQPAQSVVHRWGEHSLHQHDRDQFLLYEHHLHKLGGHKLCARLPWLDVELRSHNCSGDDHLLTIFQMSSNLSCSSFPPLTIHVNRVLIGTLSNPALDPRKLQTIFPPTAITALTNTLVNIS